MARLNYDWQTINAILARAASGGAIDDAIDAIDYLYKATYGTTTVSQITAAVNAGKIPVCVYNQVPYLYAGTSTESSTTYYIFSAAKVGATTSSATINIVYVSGTATWGNKSVSLAPLAAPTFTGNVSFEGAVQVPTRPSGDDTQYAANTAWVQDEFDTHYVTAGQKSGTTLGAKATAEGRNATASGVYSHAEGSNAVASGNNSHAEGSNTTASGNNSHAEGSNGTASGQTSHAEGANVTASGVYSHAEGVATTASGTSSHAEGSGTKASANSSHAEGYSTESNGIYSHAEGSNTIANHSCQHVFGSFNIEDPSSELGSNKGTYVEIVGNGTADDARSNARTLDWDGNEVLAGKLTIGADPVEDMDVVPKKMLDAVSITDTASGSIASFSDGADGIPMRSVQVGIEPVQNLNGYDYPWTAGGGKNKLPVSGTNKTSTGITFTYDASAGTVTLSGTATAETVDYYEFSLAAGSYIYTSGITESFTTIDTYLQTGGTTIARGDNSSSPGNSFTLAADSTVRINFRVRSGYVCNNLVVKPMARLSTEADATFAPYSNICPISGWTGAEIPRTGKNLLPFDIDRMKAINSGGTWSGNTFTSNDLTFTVDADAGTVTVNGTASANKTFFIAGRNAPDAYKFTLPDGRYALNGCPSSGSSTTYELRFQATRDGALHSYGYDRGSGTAGDVLSTDTVQVAIFVGVNFTANNLVFEPMVRLASDTDATFEPYAGQTFPVTWESQAGEVFGGYFVVNEDGSVDLTATNASYAITASTTLSNFAISAEYGSRAILSPNNMELVTSDTRIYVKSETAKSVSYEDRVAQPDIWRVYGEKSQRQIVLRAAASANIQNVNALLAPFVGTKLCYDLATPQTYHLDSIGQITSLLGQNNVWADAAGDVEVEYVADPKLYIQKVIGNSVNDGN